MVELIDVEKILREKQKGKKPPRLLVWLLKKIIHQDEINSFLLAQSLKPDRIGLAFVEDTLTMLDATYTLEGGESIDPSKRYIFVSNHPLGGLDGLALGKIIGDRVDDNIRLLVNDLLMFLKPLRSIFIPINKHGSQGKQFADTLHEYFSSDMQIFTFPAGACSRFNLKKMRIYDLEWKKMFVNKAIQYQRDVVPVYFKGRNSIAFYTLAFVRKALGIKVNIEMLFLSHEMYGNRHAAFKAYVGKPIAWQTFDKSKTAAQWAEWVKNKTYQLRK